MIIKNLPAEIPDNDLHDFLISKGLPENITGLKVKRSERNTNVDIDNLEKDVCLELIKNIHEKKYCNRPVYCRGLRNLDSPSKDIPEPEVKSTSEQSAPASGNIDPNDALDQPKASGSPILSKEESKAAKKLDSSKTNWTS